MMSKLNISYDTKELTQESKVALLNKQTQKRIAKILSENFTPDQIATQDEGKPISEVIIALDMKLQDAGKSELSNKIFEKYMEIMSIITLESKEIQEIFTQGDTKIDFSSEKYAKTLLGRANEVLLRSLEKEQDVDKIEAMFSEIRTELIQFGSFFHVTQDNNNNLDAILKKYKIKKKVVSGLDLAKGDTISHSYKEAIRNFYLRLYRNHNEFGEIMKIVDTIIEEDVKSSDVKYIIFYLGGGKSQEFPLLTLKLRTIDKKHVHFGGFNADPMILKSGLGMTILNCYLEKYNNKTFTATILEGSEGLFKEYKKLGFVIDTDLQKHEGTTLRFYNIRREATS